jgi:hypothetical protein
MSLKTENSRRVAKSRPVCMGLKACFPLHHFARLPALDYVKTTLPVHLLYNITLTFHLTYKPLVLG